MKRTGSNCKAVPSEKVPEELAQCDLGIALREPLFSTQAILPIKLGEYLACRVASDRDTRRRKHRATQ